MNGWERVPLGRITSKVGSGATPLGGSRAYKDSGIPLIRSLNVRSDGFDATDLAMIDEAQAEALQGAEVRAGDVLLNITGLGTLGRVTQAPITMDGARVNQHVCIIRSIECMDAGFLSRFLASPDQQRLMTTEASGMTRQAITKAKILEFEVPVPPLNEQRRIVAKIEELTDSSRRAREALDAVPALLDRFRQSVLAAAFRGDLTAEWRAKNPDIEPASVLLERIRLDRRGKWEEDLRAKGKDPRKVTDHEPEPLSQNSLPDLPPGWCFTGIHALLSVDREGMRTGPFGTLLGKQDYVERGVPILGIENIDRMRFVPGSKNHVSPTKADELGEYRVTPGDVLISRSGTVGDVCVVPENVGEARISTNVIRLSLTPDGMLPSFLGYLFIGSPFVLSQVSDLCSGSTRVFLNQTIISKIAFPLPPISEQQEILRRINEAFNAVDCVETRLRSMLGDLAKVDQSILAKAFRGELVPQDPKDEPTSVLLERIRGERSEAVVPKARRGRKPKELAESI